MSVTGLTVTGATVTAPPPVKIKKFNPASYPASKIMHKVHLLYAICVLCV
jgi:hypothetical protein